MIYNFSGSMAILGNSYHAECDTYDEPAFRIDFQDDAPYALTVQDSNAIGHAAFQKFIEILRSKHDK